LPPPDCSADCSAAVTADWIWLCKSDDAPEVAEGEAVVPLALAGVVACKPLATSEFNSESLPVVPLSDCESSCAKPTVGLEIVEIPDMMRSHPPCRRAA